MRFTKAMWIKYWKPPTFSLCEEKRDPNTDLLQFKQPVGGFSTSRPMFPMLHH